MATSLSLSLKKSCRYFRSVSAVSCTVVTWTGKSWIFLKNMSTIACTKSGWEFLREKDCRASALTGGTISGFEPDNVADYKLSIIHVKTGFKLSFSAYDAILQWQSFVDPNALNYCFPAYISPLSPIPGIGFDSPYVGCFVSKKSGDLTWEDIDWADIISHVDWACNYSKFPLEPNNSFLKHFTPFDGYLFSGEKEKHAYTCFISAAVTKYDWAFYMCQLTRGGGHSRVRELTMQYKHIQRKIFREIIERQSDKEIQQQSNVPFAYDVNLPIVFHEAKKFTMKGRGRRIIQHPSIQLFRPFDAFQWQRATQFKFSIPYEKIHHFFENCGEQLHCVEAKTRTRIEVVPVFHNPALSRLYLRTDRLIYATESDCYAGTADLDSVSRLLSQRTYFGIGADNEQETHRHMLVFWNYPPRGWYMLNTGGASAQSGAAACGGVIRDHKGMWVGGFAKNLGNCSILEAELWGFYRGMDLAWQRGIRAVVVNMDSIDAVKLILKYRKGGYPKSPILFNCVHMMQQFNWSVKIRHVYREGNRVAYSLAKMGFLQGKEERILHTAPSNVYPLLKEDLMGIGVPRRFLRELGCPIVL